MRNRLTRGTQALNLALTWALPQSLSILSSDSPEHLTAVMHGMRDGRWATLCRQAWSPPPPPNPNPSTLGEKNGWWTCTGTKHGERGHMLVSSAKSTKPKTTSPEGESPGAVVDMFHPSQTRWVPDLTSCGDVEPNPEPEQPNTPTAQYSAAVALERTNEKRKEA